MEGDMADNKTIILGYSLPSLQTIAAIQVVTDAYRRNMVTDKIEEKGKDSFMLQCSRSSPEIDFVEKAVKQELCNTTLPMTIKNIILGFMKPISSELFDYWKYCEHDLDLKEQFWNKVSDKLSWTTIGTIDHVRTAERIVRDDTLDLNLRYMIACCTCCKDDILTLYSQMTVPITESKYSALEFVLIWTIVAAGKSNEFKTIIGNSEETNCSFEEFGLRLAIKQSNLVATKYFLRNYPADDDEKNRRVLALCKNSHRRFPSLDLKPDIIFLIFSFLTQEQWKDVLSTEHGGEYANMVLMCLLKWPYQHLFLKAADFLFPFLPVEEYKYLMKYIARLCYIGFNYQNIWKEFWQMSSSVSKRSVLGDWITSGRHVEYLLIIGDTELIQMFLNEADTDLKSYLMSISCGRLMNGKKDLVECFINACFETKEILMEFAEEVQNKKRWTEDFKAKVINLIQPYIAKLGQKQKLEENSSPLSKKFCEDKTL